MNEIFLVKTSISCDDYIPSFLKKKLWAPVAYLSYETAIKSAQECMDRFTSWMDNDPSCSTKATYIVTKDGPTSKYTSRLFCSIDGGSAWFEITIQKCEVVK